MHTLEAVMAATIMVMVIIFTVQATSLTPLTSSTANAHIEAQLQTIGQDMLNALDYSAYGQTSSLKNDVLNWNGEEYVWNGTHYRSRSSTDTLVNSSIADMMIFVAVERGIAHNVEFTYLRDTGTTVTLPYIYNGEPSNNAIIISRKVVLSDPDIEDPAVFAANTTIQDMDVATDLYNIVNVKLSLWRM
ncbi:MAG: hypothetical protein JXA98_08600 [Methanosarcinaceae archaeon]|nr:hypothetical protein [Methanosarcinaceae archaeon]